MTLQRRRRIRCRQDIALDEFVALGTVLEALLEVVCCALALELEGYGLEGAVPDVSLCLHLWSVWEGAERVMDVRSGVCVEEDVAVLEVLRVWAVLKVLLQAVAALDAAAG